MEGTGVGLKKIAVRHARGGQKKKSQRIDSESQRRLGERGPLRQQNNNDPGEVPFCKSETGDKEGGQRRQIETVPKVQGKGSAFKSKPPIGKSLYPKCEVQWEDGRDLAVKKGGKPF